MRWARKEDKKDNKTKNKKIAYLPLVVLEPVADLTLHTFCSGLVPVEPQVRVGINLDSQAGWWI